MCCYKLQYKVHRYIYACTNFFTVHFFQQNTHYYIYFNGLFFYFFSYFCFATTFILMPAANIYFHSRCVFFSSSFFLDAMLLHSYGCTRTHSYMCFVSFLSYINVVRIWFDTSFCLVATFIAVYCFYFHLSVLFFAPFVVST